MGICIWSHLQNRKKSYVYYFCMLKKKIDTVFYKNFFYIQVNNTHVEVVSRSLISEPDFFIPSAAGMHYCDLLSPYRALEWIYIRGVQHGYKQFIL